jgi:hypothetical protein
MSDSVQKKLMTVEELAEYYGVSIEAMYKRVQQSCVEPESTVETGEKGRPRHLYDIDLLERAFQKISLMLLPDDMKKIATKGLYLEHVTSDASTLEERAEFTTAALLNQADKGDISLAAAKSLIGELSFRLASAQKDLERLDFNWRHERLENTHYLDSLKMTSGWINLIIKNRLSKGAVAELEVGKQVKKDLERLRRDLDSWGDLLYTGSMKD